MRKINSKFDTKFLSEAGSKLFNKDYFAFVELDKLACYVLVDGIDEALDKKTGYMVAESIIRSFTEKPTFHKRTLNTYIQRAHRLLQQESQEMHLKASLTVVVTDYLKMRYIEVGNTRFALIRNGRILHQSKDQSLTQILVNQEQVAKDKVAIHEERNNLYTYLGQDGFIKPYISKKFKLKDGDLWTMLTRGIWEHCDEGELIDSINDVKEPQEAIDNIEELILSKTPKEIENYTVAITFVNKVYQNPKKKITVKQVVMIMIPIILIVGGISIVCYIRHRNKQNNITEMNNYIKSGEKYIATNNYLRANEEYTQALTLAKKVKDEKKETALDNYQKLLEQIIVADEKFQDKDYIAAQSTYLEAQKLSYKADLIGNAYIEKQLEKVQKYIDVLDLLQEGDKQMDYGKPDLAKAAYLKAKALANDNYFQEGKQEAIDKIDKIDAKKAEQQKEDKAEADKKAEQQKKKEEEEAKKKEEEAKKEEEEAAKKEEEETQKEQAEEAEQKAAEEQAAKRLENKLTALEVEKQGNDSYKQDNLEDAAMYYLMARDLYQDLGMTNKVKDINDKVKYIDKLMSEREVEQSKAKLYLKQADQKVIEGSYKEAKVLYGLARDLYESAGDEKTVLLLDEKIAQINEILMPE